MPRPRSVSDPKLLHLPLTWLKSIHKWLSKTERISMSNVLPIKVSEQRHCEEPSIYKVWYRCKLRVILGLRLRSCVHFPRFSSDTVRAPFLNSWMIFGINFSGYSRVYDSGRVVSCCRITSNFCPMRKIPVPDMLRVTVVLGPASPRFQREQLPPKSEKSISPQVQWIYFMGNFENGMVRMGGIQI